MRTRGTVVVGAVALAALLAGCAGGPTIKATIGPGTTFCNDLGTAASSFASLQNSAAETRDQLLQELPAIESQLVKLENEAPSVDTVNGKSLKADLGTIAGVYANLIAALQKATGPNPVGAVLSSVNAQQGQALSDATNRVDGYASHVCKITAPSSTTSTSTTTGGETTTSIVVTPHS